MRHPLLDTNVILRHLVHDSDQSPAATKYFESMHAGETTVETTMTVVFETVYLLEKHYRVRRTEIARQLMLLLSMTNIHLVGKRRLPRIFQLYVEYEVSFADAYHAVLALTGGTGEIVSFDRDFDHLPGIDRIDPTVPNRKEAA